MANSELNVFIYRISFRVFLLFGSPTSVLITRWLWCVTYNLSLFFFCFSTLSKWIHPNKMPTVPFFFFFFFPPNFFHLNGVTIVILLSSMRPLILVFFFIFFFFFFMLVSFGGAMRYTQSEERRLRSELDGISDCARLGYPLLLVAVEECVDGEEERKKKVLLALFKCHVIVTSWVQYQSPDAQYCLDRWRTPLSPFFFLEIFFLVVVVVVVVFYPSLVYWPGRVWLTRGKPTKWARASGCVLRVRRRRHHAGITDERKRRGGRKGSRRTKPERGGGWLSLRSFSFLSF